MWRPIRTIGAPRGRRPPGKRTLYFSGGQYGISDAFEGDEEGVALSVDLPALALGECRPQYLAVLVECVRVPAAQPPHEFGRSHDVGEEERDRTAWLLAHRALDRCKPSL